jgi:3-methylcrotonyl-CoA carboxylase beta subunit
MCGRAYDPRFLWTWPNARISVMGGEQAATVLGAVSSDRDPAELEAQRAQIRARYETQGHPYHATARLWDDGIIDPLATRDTIGLALEVCANAPLGELQRPVLRI